MDAANKARLLEEELEDYPDERGDLLPGVARAWLEAGNHERAIELLTEAVELGVEDDHDCPRVVLAEVLFDLGRDDEARAQLHALRKSWPYSPEPYSEAAHLLRTRGALAEALTWYDLAIARMEPDDRADSYITVGRRQVRRALGLPQDDLDASVEHLDRHLDAVVRQARAKMTEEHVLAFWPRAEVPLAHEKWPEIVPHNDSDAAMEAQELANRELAETVSRIIMVPVTAARLTEFADRTGLDPLDQRTRLTCVQEILADGLALTWPPERTSPCWCGSGIKYEKCCGRPL